MVGVGSAHGIVLGLSALIVLAQNARARAHFGSRHLNFPPSLSQERAGVAKPVRLAPGQGGAVQKGAVTPREPFPYGQAARVELLYCTV